jgi:hypothetical protein
MILIPPLCTELLQTIFVIFSSILETKSFATCASKFSYVLSSSVFKIDNTILRKAEGVILYNPSFGSRYEYSRATSISTLRSHITKYHLELSLTLAKEEGWENSLPGLV